MDNTFSPDIQQAIQNSLQEIAAQLGRSLNASATEQLYTDAAALLDHIPHEPLTLAHVAGTLLVFQVQGVETEELEWFRSQVQQCPSDEDVEELIESMHREDAL
jgi:regulator of sirC expression with transglutaminase-like and TPR domain